MKKIGNSIREYLQKFGFIAGIASTILAAYLWEGVSQAIQNTLNHQIVGFYLMVLIALICLLLVTYSLMRIEKIVENRNYARFITSKAERLRLMTDRIKNAEKSIYILSDLSSVEEVKMEEHKNYIKALKQVLADKKVKEVIRIVAPSYASTRDTKMDRDWIFTSPVAEKYVNHFIDMWEFNRYSLRTYPKIMFSKI